MRYFPSLEDQILEVLRQALVEGRMAAAEHLLCAVETLCEDECPGSTPASVYLGVAGMPMRGGAPCAEGGA